jgi:hypothetical protein
MFFATYTAVRRLRSLFAALLVSVLLAPAAFGVAQTLRDDHMGNMSCCKNGKDSCCRRKAMNGGQPAFRAANPCDMPCSGIPGVAAQMAVPPPQLTLSLAPPAVESPLRLTSGAARCAAGIDLSLRQRPPPRS